MFRKMSNQDIKERELLYLSARTNGLYEEIGKAKMGLSENEFRKKYRKRINKVLGEVAKSGFKESEIPKARWALKELRRYKKEIDR